MRAFVLQLSELLHRLTLAACFFLFLAMTISTAATVVLRYGLSTGFIWLQDVSLFAFGILAILSVPIALYHDRHVRVDVFRERQKDRARQNTDLFAYLFFLVPVFGLLLAYSNNDALVSFLIGEKSPQIGGLPGYFIVKAALPVSCLLILIQGLARLMRSPISSGSGD